MIFKDLTERQKKVIIYVLGIGATLMYFKVVSLLSPIFALGILFIYSSQKQNKRPIKTLIILIIWVIVSTRYLVSISFQFTTTYAAFWIGICLINLLEDKKFLGLTASYISSLIVSIFSSVFSLDYEFFLHGYYVGPRDILPTLIDRFNIIWFNKFVIAAIPISLLLAYLIAEDSEDYVFAYSVAFLIVLIGVWLNIYTYPEGGTTQLTLAGGT